MLLVDEPRIEAHVIRRARAAIAVGSLKKLPAAIQALVEALRASEPGWPVGAIRANHRGPIRSGKVPESSEDFDFLGIGALRASRPLSVIR